MKLIGPLLIALALTCSSLPVLQGCTTTTGVSTETFNDKALVAHRTVEALANTAAILYQSGKLSDQDRSNTVATLNDAETALDIAASLNATSPALGQEKLQATLTILTALQTYLNGAAK